MDRNLMITIIAIEVKEIGMLGQPFKSMKGSGK